MKCCRIVFLHYLRFVIVCVEVKKYHSYLIASQPTDTGQYAVSVHITHQFNNADLNLINSLIFNSQH